MPPKKKAKKNLKLPHKMDKDILPKPPAKAPKSLPVSKCRWTINPKSLGFKTTADVKPLRNVVGQPRALAALKLGTELRGKGYNIFVTGLSATGRSSTVKNILENMKPVCAPAPDRIYVNNFKIPDQPRLINMPRGKGVEFRRDMASLVDTLKNMIPGALEDESVLSRKRALAEKYARKEAEIFKELEDKVGTDGFALVQVQMGPYSRPDVFPIIDGNPVAPNQVGQLVDEGKFSKDKLKTLYKKYQGYKAELRAVLKQARQLGRELSDKTRSIEKEVVEEILQDFYADVGERYPYEGVKDYLEEIKDFIIENQDIFSMEEQSDQPPGIPQIPHLMGGEDPRMADPFIFFEVNVVRDGLAEEPCPVVIEDHPNYLNLFGSVDREWRAGGYWTSDFTMIKGGSLLRADGGYLVLNVMDVLQDAIAWRTLIRTLKTRHLQIQGMDSLLSLAPSSMKPQPIDLSVTVILIGETYIYHLLSEYVEDFQRVFKVRADFSTVMPRGKKQIEYYASLAHKLALIENLLQLDAGAVAKLAEQGARKADANGKISARLGEIADILREASYHAQVDGSKIVKRKHVDQAISEAEYRHDLVRERMDEYIENKILLIDTEGESVGQINALAVYDLGKIAFGRPNKVTCEVSIGERGIVNIEREAKLSGKIHDKGVLILEGYLRNRYGTHGTISLSASIAFEQSYGMIDGDSASMAEVIVLTSEVTGLPLRQDLAVTGSINQKGDVQAIGGVNEKVEGFFRVCQLRKLTGTQGVVIPESNVGELMLSEKVLAAIASGRFHVYPVKRVEDALEIFMGVKAGKTLKSGDYTTGSIHDRMLRKFEEFKKKSNGGDDDKDEDEKEDNGKPKKKKIIRK